MRLEKSEAENIIKHWPQQPRLTDEQNVNLFRQLTELDFPTHVVENNLFSLLNDKEKTPQQ